MLKFFFKKTHLDFMMGWITDEVAMGSLLPVDNGDENMLLVLLGKEGEAFDKLLESLAEDEEVAALLS